MVHARGFLAYGTFTATGTWGTGNDAEPIERYTRAKQFSTEGKQTDVALRFSTVIGGRDSSEAARDPRGFAIKFYTEYGNGDLVGNNLGVFFIRDAIKFPDVIHSLKPDPVTFRQEPARIFDFMSQTPESMHMLVNLFSPRGIPADYRHQQGFGVNLQVGQRRRGDQAGQVSLDADLWGCQPDRGRRRRAPGERPGPRVEGSLRRDRARRIPEWDLLVQMMDDHDHPELDWDPLDDTKVWPEELYEPKKVGTVALNRNVENFFAENEQISFGTGVLVDGLDFSDDKMLVGRTFSYSDTQRYRVGPNYLQLPVNSPKNAKVATNQRDGQMTYLVDSGGENPHVNYEPSTMGGLTETDYATQDEQGPVLEGRLTRARIPRTNDYQQAGERFRLMEDWERDDLVHNFVELIGQATTDVQRRMVWHFFMVEDELGQRVGDGLGLSADDVRDLPPLPTQQLSEAELNRLENLGKNGPRDVAGKTMTHCVPNKHVLVAS